MTVDDIARRIKNVSDQLAVEQALGDAGRTFSEMKFDVKGT